jgi:hypothetical protein
MQRITPLRGTLWQSGELPLIQPPRIIQLAGHPFQLAQWRMSYPGVALQYRQMVQRKSHHLFVHPDGSYTIDHYDDFNPDMGLPLLHLLYDLVPYKLERALRLGSNHE